MIPLGKGKFALVDPEDYATISKYHWSARKSKSGYYAVRKATYCGTRVTIFMHRQIMAAAAGQQVHHINQNRLDNRKINLQLLTPAEHSQIHLANRITRKIK
ncbi:MAG: HNH endonuclease [Desulfobulbaceae bacterium]|nr:HNH endonuclease [Desulfobulbaceae bacterium]